ncbi:peptidase C78, ubiquitin fold modifier-specific peptidase 1/ 2 isoform X2 [Carex rostrata]
MEADDRRCTVRILCSKRALLASNPSLGIRWLIGSPRFISPLTIVASFRCLHTLPADPFSPDFSKEADDIRILLLRGFDIIGALFVGSQNRKEDANKAIEASHKLRSCLYGDKASHSMVAAFTDAESSEIQFFVSANSTVAEVESVLYEDNPENILWDKGCLMRCQLVLKLPLYAPLYEKLDLETTVSALAKRAIVGLKDPCTVYLVESGDTNSDKQCSVVHGKDLDCVDAKPLPCSHFSSRKGPKVPTTRENVDAIRVAILTNPSRSEQKPGFPAIEYLAATKQTRFSTISLRLDILCYTSQDFDIATTISEIVIPGLIGQLKAMAYASNLETSSSQNELCPYHFLPSGLLIPITAIYDLKYGEMEEKQGELRKSLHLRLGLPLDRPLMRIANALCFDLKDKRGGKGTRDGSSSLLRNVHFEVPTSGVSGGDLSLIEGSYEYYHYLQDGVDDNGWGCAYRSLQTIISWYRLQQYTAIDVPSHREIQQALVEIGDKDPSFIGSREWIGAIELSFVLDKLLGVSCKIINVRSGDELPEKCRELSFHFQTQGTPIMIGGGVLAYTLLGVEYNDVTGECAFLILDPHYTGSDDLKKIVSGGWCSWKRPVDSKGRSFFLKDKFYNLLLPQRPNMV